MLFFPKGHECPDPGNSGGRGRDSKGSWAGIHGFSWRVTRSCKLPYTGKLPHTCGTPQAGWTMAPVRNCLYISLSGSAILQKCRSRSPQLGPLQPMEPSLHWVPTLRVEVMLVLRNVFLPHLFFQVFFRLHSVTPSNPQSLKVKKKSW